MILAHSKSTINVTEKMFYEIKCNLLLGRSGFITSAIVLTYFEIFWKMRVYTMK